MAQRVSLKSSAQRNAAAHGGKLMKAALPKRHIIWLPAQIAVKNLKATGTRAVNSAPTPVLYILGKAVNQLSKEQFEREKNYRASLSVAKSMLKNGIINEQDYCKIDTILIAKYCPIFGSL